jgi:hypothetical protein
MPEKLPSNSVGEIMRMCEGADLKDLIIIMDQVDQEKHLYNKSEMNDILLFISHRRKVITSKVDERWKNLKDKMGL